jgi:hypothetical protein
MHGRPASDLAVAEGRAKMVLEMLSKVFEPMATHHELIPQIIVDRHLSQEEKKTKICVYLILFGDFIEKKCTEPQQVERMKLWDYFGHKSWSSREGNLEAAKALQAAYEREKSILAAKETAAKRLVPKEQHFQQEEQHLGRKRGYSSGLP